MTRLHWLLLVLMVLAVVSLLSIPFTREATPPARVVTRPATQQLAHPAAAPVEANWWQGGRLHNVSLLTWRDASEANKLATAGDWLANTKWKGHVNTPDDLRRIRLAAERLVRAMDIVAAAHNSDYQNTGAIAAGIIALSNDSGP
jgi:hypothetical protein